MRRLLPIVVALVLSACTVLHGYPGELPKDYDYSKVQVNVGSWTEVSGKCAEWGIPFAAACACWLQPGVDQKPTDPCQVPPGYQCVVWTVDDEYTLKHELAHCVYGEWH